MGSEGSFKQDEVVSEFGTVETRRWEETMQAEEWQGGLEGDGICKWQLAVSRGRRGGWRDERRLSRPVKPHRLVVQPMHATSMGLLRVGRITIGGT